MLNSLFHLFRRRHLTPRQRQILACLAAGRNLKSHRQIDGTKYYRLHNQKGEDIAGVRSPDVERLRALGLIASNMKFPAATYLLTDKGLELVTRDCGARPAPLTSLRFDR